MADELKTLQIWRSEPWSRAAPRQIKLLFTDATGAAWLQWNYPGWPQRAQAVSERSFRAWIRRNGAQPE